MVRDAAYEEEKKRTDEARKDLIQYLSHDTSSTRRRLVAMLDERIDVIETEIAVENYVKVYVSALK